MTRIKMSYLTLAMFTILAQACSPSVEASEDPITLTSTPQIAETKIGSSIAEATLISPVLTLAPEAIASEVLRLSPDLVRGCEGRDPNAQGPRVGEPAIEFSLLDVGSNQFVLSELLAEKPVVLIFGSFT